MADKRTTGDRTLDELEGVEWGVSTHDSYLVTNIHRLRNIPLKKYRLEDLRLMIGQQVGLAHLVPRAPDHLEAHPLASGTCIPVTYWPRSRAFRIAFGQRMDD
jgi:hypothetical protein